MNVNTNTNTNTNTNANANAKAKANAKTRVKKRGLALMLAVSLVIAATSSCGSDFRPKNAVESVRILAAKADKPYAAPGESVHIEALVHDGRKNPGDPMRLFWFPIPCIDPPSGQYFGCYPFFDVLYPLGVDLTPQLREAKDTTITIPADTLTRVRARPGQPGSAEPFATAYVFMVACAGHVERVTRPNGQALNSLPLGCFNARGERLGPDDFVLGFTRVFVFASRKNAIPTLDGVTFEGVNVDPAKGVATGKCTKNKQGDCNTVKFDVLFQDSMAEADPDNITVDGNVARETLYVDWFTSVGKFGSERKILFDAYLGRPPKTTIEFSPPDDPVKGTVWAVFHDNRGGTTWVEIPIDIK